MDAEVTSRGVIGPNFKGGLKPAEAQQILAAVSQIRSGTIQISIREGRIVRVDSIEESPRDVGSSQS